MADFKCSKCGRTFAMAAHLARHMSASHGTKKKVVAKKKAKKRGAKKRAPVASKRKVAKGRRPAAPATRTGLRSMSIDALTQLIDDARAELRVRIAELQKNI